MDFETHPVSDILKYHKEYLNDPKVMEAISKNKSLRKSFVLGNSHLAWNKYYLSENLPPNIMLEFFRDLIDWKSLSKNKKLKLHHVLENNGENWCNFALTRRFPFRLMITHLKERIMWKLYEKENLDHLFDDVTRIRGVDALNPLKTGKRCYTKSQHKPAENRRIHIHRSIVYIKKETRDETELVRFCDKCVYCLKPDPDAHLAPCGHGYHVTCVKTNSCCECLRPTETVIYIVNEDQCKLPD